MKLNITFTALLALSLPLCAQSKAKAKVKPKTAPVAQVQPEAKPETKPEPKPVVKPRVQLETNYGNLILELEPEAAPRTVENFLAYVKDGFYEGTIFHRVIDSFMIQGGGMAEDMNEKPTKPPVINEARQASMAGLINQRGTVAMARTENPHSATSQFFINIIDNKTLDPGGLAPGELGYTVFGRVVEGMDVVDKIAKVRTLWRKGMQNVPDYPVRLKKTILLESSPKQ